MKNWKKLRVCLPFLAAFAVGAGTIASLGRYAAPVFEAAEKPSIDLSFLDARGFASDAKKTEAAVVTEAAEKAAEEAPGVKKVKKRKKSVPAELLATAAVEESARTEMISEPSSYRDGTYAGTGTGFNGPITVSVTVSGGRIAGIAMVSASDNEPFLTNVR